VQFPVSRKIQGIPSNFHHLPKAHRRRVYTTNMLERVMREIKRRTNVVGIFPNEASADRLIGAHLIERHERWQCETMRYLSMERLDTATRPIAAAP